MTQLASATRGAGFIYVHDARAGAQGLFFGVCGEDRSSIDYQVTIAERSAARDVGLRMRGDFPALLRSGVLADVGVRPLSLQMELNGERFTVELLPDRSQAANALFQTSTGLRGAIIEVKSSPWVAVAVIAISAATVVTLAAIEKGKDLEIKGKVDGPGGTSVDVDVKVGGDGHDGGGTGDGGTGDGGTGDGGNGGGS